ncbi:hypothetical protein L3Q82_026835, partial [Scortum barcoo]
MKTSALQGLFSGTQNLLSLLSDILGRLAEAIYEYTAYPSCAQLSQVAEAPLFVGKKLFMRPLQSGTSWSAGLHYLMQNRCCVQINEEFKRITTVSLESTFMSKLDQCTSVDIVSMKGGATGARIRQIKEMLLRHNTVEVRREVAICCLVVYLGEKEDDHLKEFD